MTFADKIDEWIKEVETRPSSALMILKLIAGRMRDLTERNEELMAENIVLQNGTRVQEYEKRITHLEYQLALLKKRFGADGELLEGAAGQEQPEPQKFNLLAYNAQGRIMRFRLPAGTELQVPGAITGETSAEGELPRLLTVPEGEDVLLFFTSGRVSTFDVADLPLSDEAERIHLWKDAALPDEPRAGELLACLVPLSRLPTADYFLQVSRRGSVKKTLRSMSETILANHYLGRGTLQKADQAFDTHLCQKKDFLVMVSAQGRVLLLDVDELSYASEERMRLEATDYIVASMIMPAGQALLCLTQAGKVIERARDTLDVSKSSQSRGQSLIPPTRLEQGTRFIGALGFDQSTRLIALDSTGKLSVYAAAALSAAGAIKSVGQFRAIGAAAPAAEGDKK
jgi:DNA gyrase/topoisomerase IV subunit A